MTPGEMAPEWRLEGPAVGRESPVFETKRMGGTKVFAFVCPTMSKMGLSSSLLSSVEPEMSMIESAGLTSLSSHVPTET